MLLHFSVVAKIEFAGEEVMDAVELGEDLILCEAMRELRWLVVETSRFGDTGDFI